MASPTVNGVNGVNGVAPQSAFFDHLCQYPVVTDGLTSIQKNKYGQQTLALSTSALETFESLAKPVLPYLAKPYEYVSPYVKKVDGLGDRTLDNFDQHFPVVRKPTAEVYKDTKDFVLYPVRKGIESRDHVVSVYNGERKQINGDGVFPLSKALAVTAIVVATETLGWVREYLTTATAAAKEVVQEKTASGTN
ncbi:pathogenesis associated protein [Grosmannia clavigera kw1407]|uniref:Pathogenesis associated protein n=1 Tax=Grosmannia clavigera (strain kw1407 / UAMH 11150) TaxID=655863 RepID=F0X7H6_GROCL|nr:pathogenesis associated protein [Grosmannia clavigera kw1407]EFX06670.1 pathogenesis associated protein [Grosmannia clavigera kw1407]